MADVDYGYEDVSGYGYGDAEPDADYGYADAAPETDYGYGDSDDGGYGYGDAEPEAKPVEPVEKHRPKRRCSVTKFNLDDDSALTAADRIRELRGNDGPASDDGYKSTDSTDRVTESKSKSSSTSSKKGLLGRLRK